MELKNGEERPEQELWNISYSIYEVVIITV